MASWMSQARQFTTYTPEVDSELYGKLLQKKETDYQKGIQNIYQQGQTIASLPIANTAARSMVQQKLDAFNSKLNQSTGVDWSDRSVQKLTGEAINSIGNDPIVSNAVEQTMALKKQHQNLLTDTDTTDGKNIANKDIFLQEQEAYINGPADGKFGKGSDYGGQYHNYMDADSLIHDHFKKLHPDLDKQVFTAGQIGPDGKKIPEQGWDKIIRQYKGVDRDVLANEMDQFIATTPGLKTQLSINSDYQTKNDQHDFGGNYADKVMSQKNAEAIGIKKDNDRLAFVLATSKDPAVIVSAKDRIQKNKEQIDNISSYISNPNNHTVLSTLYDSLPEETRKQYNRELYNDIWKTEQINLHTWSEVENDVGGTPPYDKKWNMHDRVFKEGMDRAKNTRDEKKLQMEEEDHANKPLTEEEKAAKKEDKSKNQIYIELGAHKPIDAAYDYLGHEQLLNNNLINQSKLSYANSILDNATRGNLISYTDGVYSIKNGKITDPDTGKPITNEDYINKLYDKKMKVYESGNYNSNEPGAVKLDVKDIDALSEIKTVMRENEAISTRIKRADKLWDQHLNDLSKKYNVSPELLNTYNEINKKMRMVVGDEIDPSTIPGSNLPHLPEELRNELGKHIQFLNDNTRSSLPVYNSWETLLTGGKTETNTEVIGIATSILSQHMGKNQGIKKGKSEYPIATELLSGKNEKGEPKNISIGYYTDEIDGKTYMRVADATSQENVPISTEQALMLKFKAHNPYKRIERILDLNDDNGSSNTGQDNVTTWENAIPKGYVKINNEPSEVRVHYERNKNGIYPHVYMRYKDEKGNAQVRDEIFNAVSTLAEGDDKVNEWVANQNKKKYAGQ